jgi:alpha-amylase/alpha-mannosidase (GH57 family)
VSKFDHDFLCLYGHFSQPRRGNPLTGLIGSEEEAAPYHNWNERITNRCYKPNAEADNYRHISFSFGEPLLEWLQRRAPETYQKIIDSDHGQNALATAFNHTILPLARKRDKRTQILWGIAAFEHHFGRKPLGFWLPEMAVDSETLGLLAESGIRYTLLAQQQIRNLPLNGGAGPYRVDLPRGRSMGVFVRDDGLSSEISFNIHNLGGAGKWARNVLMPMRNKSKGQLLLLATAGETFGHHYAGEEQFLHWLVNREAPSIGFHMTTLDEFFTTHEPTKKVQIEEPSSWSDHHGLSNWATGQPTDKGDTTWRGALRRALDNAASELDSAYENATRSHNLDAWELRDQYAPVLLGTITADEFLAQSAPDVKNKESIKQMLTAQELIQRSYNSYTFTDDHLDGSQIRYTIACAAAALATAQRVTHRDIAERFISDLAVVASGSITGTTILRSVIEELNLMLETAD